MSLVKSKQRVADHGEVFTPPELVEAMIGLVQTEAERIDSRFLEPACGSGNFLVPVLRRKLATVDARYGKSDFEKRHHALLALMSIYGIEHLADIFETVINKSENVKAMKKERGDEIIPTEKKELSDEEKEYKSKRKQIQEKLIKFATRIPAFMYLTDFRDNTLKDVVTKLEPHLFKTVTGLTVDDFNLLVSLNVFNSTHMNQAVFAFGRYENSSLSYTGIDSHQDLRHFDLYDTVLAREA